MNIDTVGVGTHQKVLIHLINKLDKPILELGAGDYSTPLIHRAAKKRKLDVLTIDSYQEWADRFDHLKTDSHQIVCLDRINTYEFYKKDHTEWGLVFVDNYSWDMRVLAVYNYKDTADYVVLHDTRFCAENNIIGMYEGYLPDEPPRERDFSETFTYWVEFMPESGEEPPTLVGSNKIDLSNLEIEGMIISNKFKA